MNMNDGQQKITKNGQTIEVGNAYTIAPSRSIADQKSTKKHDKIHQLVQIKESKTGINLIFGVLGEKKQVLYKECFSYTLWDIDYLIRLQKR